MCAVATDKARACRFLVVGFGQTPAVSDLGALLEVIPPHSEFSMVSRCVALPRATSRGLAAAETHKPPKTRPAPFALGGERRVAADRGSEADRQVRKRCDAHARATDVRSTSGWRADARLRADAQELQKGESTADALGRPLTNAAQSTKDARDNAVKGSCCSAGGGGDEHRRSVHHDPRHRVRRRLRLREAAGVSPTKRRRGARRRPGVAGVGRAARRARGPRPLGKGVQVRVHSGWAFRCAFIRIGRSDVRSFGLGIQVSVHSGKACRYTSAQPRHAGNLPPPRPTTTPPLPVVEGVCM